MTLVPVNERLLVRPVLKPEKSQGGVVIPDTSREDNDEGEIVHSIYPVWPVGRRIVFTPYAATEVTLPDGEKQLLVPIKAILAYYAD